jgi:hypothetical protein
MDFRTVGGGTGAPKTLTDTFTRADTTAGLGNGWVGNGNSQLAASPGHYTAGRILSNKARFFLAGTGGGTPPGSAYVNPQIFPGLNGKNQFCEMIVSAINITVASLEIGPMVAFNGDPFNGTAVAYSVFYANSLTSANFVVWGGQAFNSATYTLQNNITVAIGDRIRLSVQFASAANTVIVSRNGTVVFSAVDNNASRPGIIGIPGMYVGVANAGGSTCDVSSFICGAGT